MATRRRSFSWPCSTRRRQRPSIGPARGPEMVHQSRRTGSPRCPGEPRSDVFAWRRRNRRPLTRTRLVSKGGRAGRRGGTVLAGHHVTRTAAEFLPTRRMRSSGTKGGRPGIPLAEFNLGTMYFNGNGVAQDRALGAQWIRKPPIKEASRRNMRLASCTPMARGSPKTVAPPRSGCERRQSLGPPARASILPWMLKLRALKRPRGSSSSKPPRRRIRNRRPTMSTWEKPFSGRADSKTQLPNSRARSR